MMKYTTTQLTFSLVLLIFICGASGQESPVKDTDGNEVKVGLEYTLVAKILTSSFGLGGGLSLDNNCPPTVVQDTSDKVGLPVVFNTIIDLDEVIVTSFPLIIQFASPTPCDEDGSSTNWEIQYDESLHKSAVKVGDSVRQSYFELKEVLPSQYTLSYGEKDIRFAKDDFFSSKRRLIVVPSYTVSTDTPFVVSITRATTNSSLMIRKPPVLSNPTA